MSFFEIQPPASARMSEEAGRMSRILDFLIYPPVFLVLVGTFHLHYMLLGGDWDFWVDWKDRQWWPIVAPVTTIMFPVIVQYITWQYFRLPIGATLCVLALFFGEWMNRVFGFEWWAGYPLNFVWPSLLLPSALVMDAVLLLTKNWILTAIFGGGAYALIFWPANLVTVQPFHLPVDYHGNLLSLADVMGLHYIRTSTPEYLRLIERGSIRAFGGETVAKVAFFAMFVCQMQYFFWWWAAKFFAAATYAVRAKDRAEMEKLVEPEQIREAAA
jgi:methane/ammonia monooxygenase subunit A